MSRITGVKEPPQLAVATTVEQLPRFGVATPHEAELTKVIIFNIVIYQTALTDD